MRDLTDRQTPSALRGLYRELSFSTRINNGGWYYDRLTDWHDISADSVDCAFEILKPLATTDPNLWAQELEFLQSMRVNWRDKGLGTLFMRSDIKVSNREQASKLRPELRAIGAAIAETISKNASEMRETAQAAVMPINKQKGAPLWIPSNDQESTVALASIYGRSEFVRDADRIMMAQPAAKVGMVITLYLRIQQARKDTESFVLENGALVPGPLAALPKRRKVQAVPWGYNYCLCKISALMRRALEIRFPLSSGNFPLAADVCKRADEVVALDLSAYDTTIAGETLNVFREEVLIPALAAAVSTGVMTTKEESKAIEADSLICTMSMLGPPAHLDSGCRLIDAFGELRSGEKDTAVKGTLINLARGRLKMREFGLVGEFINSGDDTVIALKGSQSQQLQRYVDQSEFLGFKEEVAKDTSFLMKRLPRGSRDNGTWGHSYVGRMLLSTLNKEASREPSSIAIAGGGIGIRNALLVGHPKQGALLSCLHTAANGRASKQARTRLRAAIELAGSNAYMKVIEVAAVKASVTKARKDLDALNDIADILSSLGAVAGSPNLDGLEQVVGKATRNAFMSMEDFETASKELPLREAENFLRKRVRA